MTAQIQFLVRFDALVRHGMIAAADLDLFHWVESPAEALDALKGVFDAEIDRPTPAFARSTTCCESIDEDGRDSARDCHAADRHVATPPPKGPRR